MTGLVDVARLELATRVEAPLSGGYELHRVDVDRPVDLDPSAQLVGHPAPGQFFYANTGVQLPTRRPEEGEVVHRYVNATNRIALSAAAGERLRLSVTSRDIRVVSDVRERPVPFIRTVDGSWFFPYGTVLENPVELSAMHNREGERRFVLERLTLAE